jgi:hypothetical protein
MSARPELLEAIRLGTLAPSGHNSQPWVFVLQDDRVRLLPDPTRRLPIADPDEHELHISLGCALENMLIAGRHRGFAPEVDYFPPEHPAALVVRFPVGQAVERPELFAAIPERQTTRRGYKHRPIPPDQLSALEAAGRRDGVTTRLVTDRAAMDAIGAFAAAGARAQWADKAFRKELISWIRFNRKEAEQWRDGLTAPALGLATAPRWLGALLMRVSTAAAQARRATRAVRKSSALMVFAADRNDRRHWVDVGRSFERVALTATALGMRHAHLNMACEVTAVRRKLQAHLNLKAEPLLVVRLGYARPLPRSPRRPLEDVFTARPSDAVVASGVA